MRPTRRIKTSTRDALGELDRLRQQAMGSAPVRSPRTTAARPATRAAAATNGAGELHRDIQLTLPRADFHRARRFSLTLQVQDGDQQVVESVQDFQVDFSDTASIEKILLRLNIALAPKG